MNDNPPPEPPSEPLTSPVSGDQVSSITKNSIFIRDVPKLWLRPKPGASFAEALASAEKRGKFCQSFGFDLFHWIKG